jgi:multidrug efflux system membrane fusion protein
MTDFAATSSLPLNAPLRRPVWWGLGLIVLLLAGAALRVSGNTRQAAALEATLDADSRLNVSTVQPKAGAALRELSLPGTLKGRREAAVYARTGGYLKRWTKDIGDTVRPGELLAELDAPEVDQELGQAVAARDQVKARLALAQSSRVRWELLGEENAVSRQELDERRAAFSQAQADLAAADANVRRLEAMQGLRRIVAPFHGVVVRRNAEVGALISANATSGRELYQVAEIEVLRIDLAVPQAYAAEVRPGHAVQVRWPERPSQTVEGKVSRVSPGIDIATRTRQVVIELPNPGQALLPGSYVDVQLRAGAPGGRPQADAARPLTVPPGALQFRQDGPRVALLEGEDRIVLRNVKLGRDLGREVEVVSGLSPGDRIVMNPPDSITEGERVVAQALGGSGRPDAANKVAEAAGDKTRKVQ